MHNMLDQYKSLGTSHMLMRTQCLSHDLINSYTTIKGKKKKKNKLAASQPWK